MFWPRATPSPAKLRRRRPLRLETLEGRALLAGDVSLQPAVDISPPEQMVIELINRARAAPEAEAARLGIGLNDGLSTPISPTAKSPLAPQQSLQRAAELHSRDMLDRNYFSHTSPSGTTPSDRARAAGYPSGAGENLALLPSSDNDWQADAESTHALLFGSAGHRQNMLLDHYRDVGVGIETGSYDFPGYGPFPAIMTTELFGATGQAFITGVAYTDSVIVDTFYSVGEGIGGLQIEATNGQGETYATHSGPSGGYAIAVPDGTYTLRVRLQDRPGQFNLGTFTVAASNTKVDVRTDRLPPEEVPSFDPADTDRSGTVTPLDALLVLNSIRRINQAPPTAEELERLDVNQDGVVTALDALLVLNHLRQASRPAAAAGEADFQAVTADTDPPRQPLTTQVSQQRWTTLESLAVSDTERPAP